MTEQMRPFPVTFVLAYSGFADLIEKYVFYQESSGSWSEVRARNLRYFDRFCAERFPGRTLCQEMVDAWYGGSFIYFLGYISHCARADRPAGCCSAEKNVFIGAVGAFLCGISPAKSSAAAQRLISHLYLKHRRAVISILPGASSHTFPICIAGEKISSILRKRKPRLFAAYFPTVRVVFINIKQAFKLLDQLCVCPEPEKRITFPF